MCTPIHTVRYCLLELGLSPTSSTWLPPWLHILPKFNRSIDLVVSRFTVEPCWTNGWRWRWWHISPAQPSNIEATRCCEMVLQCSHQMSRFWYNHSIGPNGVGEVLWRSSQVFDTCWLHSKTNKNAALRVRGPNIVQVSGVRPASLYDLISCGLKEVKVLYC